MNKSFFSRDGAAAGTVPTLFELDSAQPGVVYDVFDGDFAAKEGEQTAWYRAFVSLKSPSDITIEGAVVDGAGKELLKIPAKTAANRIQYSIEGSAEVSGEVFLWLRARYISGGAYQSPELTLSLTPILPKDSHKLEHPTKRKEGEPVRRYGDQQRPAGMGYRIPKNVKYVVTVLNRNPSDTTDIDYLCCWGMADSHHPYFGLPGQGSVTGPRNGKFLPDSPLLRAACVLYPRDKDRGGGIMTAALNGVKLDFGAERRTGLISADSKAYEIEAGDVTFSKDVLPNVARYAFLGAWQGKKLVYDEKEQQGQYFDYELKLSLPFQIPNRANPVVYNVIVTSRDTTSPVALVDRSVLPVKIMYGCLAKGSMVLTPDGEKPVEDIRIGDRVSTPKGEAAVLNVWQGFECMLTRIVADGGRSILVTDDHPMLTVEGFVRARDLDAASNKLIMKDGPCDIAAVETVEYNDSVYNFEVEGGRLIVGGFVTGDFTAQNGEG